MIWQIIVDSGARKQLKRIPRRDVERILEAISEFSVNPFSGDIEKVEGEKDVWRRRVGSYRIFYEIYIAKKIVYVFEVKRRTSTTY